MQRTSFLSKVIFALLCSTSVFAQGRHPAAPGLQPFLTEQSDAFRFRSIEDDHGGFYLVWTHEVSPGSFTLNAQHVNDQGATLWALPGKPVVQALSSIDNWDIFPDGHGNLTLTWIAADLPRLQRYDAGGQALWPNDLTVTASSAPCRAPTGVVDALGGVYLVWSEKDFPDRWVLVAQHTDLQGKSNWYVNGIRVSQRPSEQRHPRMVYDGQAGVIIAWKDFRESASQMQAQRLDYRGNRLWGDQGIVITAPAGPPHEAPILEPLGNGQAVLAWVAQQSGKNRLFLQSMTAAGAFRWAALGLNITFGDWDQWNPVLYGDGQGSIWTGWEDFRNGSQWQVYVGNLNSDAHIVWPSGEVALAPYTADQGKLALVDDGLKGVFGVWVDNRLGHPGIYAQEVNSQGLLLMGPQGTPVIKNMTDAGLPKIINLAEGRAAVFWTDKPAKGRWAFYWTALQTPTKTASPSFKNP
jgi:hypothetical protein